MAAPTKFELFMVATGRRSDQGQKAADLLVVEYRIEIIDWTDALADLAIEAFRRFGKGRHKAALNFGDCMAYALAKSLDAPLLYKGNDFTLTDLRPIARPPDVDAPDVDPPDAEAPDADSAAADPAEAGPK
ncbi:MAG: type II toxin-antitoxin system VapC family toxin [Sphingomonas bacterium]|nr:type II toxin-antitoxin system VapC family toxin [Sphingomonas bacterium]